MTEKNCFSCEWWDQRYRQNLDLGVCLRMGATKWSDNEIALGICRDLIPKEDLKPVTDFGAVRTLRDFGCTYHSDDFPFRKLSET